MAWEGILNVAAKLLLIDDDVVLGAMLKALLTERGYQVEVAHTAVSGLQKAYAFSPDVIILDVVLPDIDGWEVCRRFREMADIPIILLTGLGSGQDILRGLELGVEHYIVKPITGDEIVARVQAVLRRVARPCSPSNGQSRFAFGSVAIDFHKRKVTVDGQRIDLTPTEFRLLSCLAQHSGRVLSHEFLLCKVWGPEYAGETDYLRLYISRLRRKIEKGQPQQDIIRTEWNLGYRLG